MPIDDRLPVLVGVGQVNHTDGDAPDPIDLLVEASRRAADDAGAPSLLGQVQSVRVVHILSRGYPDPGRLLADALSIGANHTLYTTDGGHQPQAVLNQAAQQMQDGKVDVVLVGGGECWRTRNRLRARGQRSPWRSQSEDVTPTETLGDPIDMTSPVETSLGLTDPAQAYPLIELAIANRLQRSPAEQQAVAAGLWARFSEVAATNPYAVLPRARTAAELLDVGPDNRMIGYPYPKLLNSNSSVDQAAALLMCTVERARAAGVPMERWVFLHGAAEAHDVQYLTNRWDLAESPAIRLAGAGALHLAGAGIDDVAHVDLYSCFPSAVQVAANELGLSLDRQLTVTGGLTFAGGPWNAYVMQSVASMARRLREDAGSLGLVSANGGLLTKHAVGVYGAGPPSRGTRVVDVQADVDAGPRRPAVEGGRHEVAVETYTVMHDRDGAPVTAFVFGLNPEGFRSLGVSDDPVLMTELLSDPPLGRHMILVDGRIVDNV